MIHSAIVKIFLFLVLIFISLFFALTHGITIDHIKVPGLEIDTLYIKLDKKLIVTVDRVGIAPFKKSPQGAGSIKEVEKIAGWMQFLPHYFSHIQVNDLTIGQRTLHLLYLNDIFYVDNDTLQIAAKLAYRPENKTIVAELHRLLLKEPNLTLSGRFLYKISAKEWDGEGLYHGFGIEGHYRLYQRKNLVRFSLDSQPFPSIKPLVDYLDPAPPIKAWIYPKIPAKKYLLRRLEGEIVIKKDGSIVFDPARINASATVYDAEIHFQKGVPPVTTPRIDIGYHNDTLSFKLTKPRYAGKPLDGSHVEIRELSKRSAKLDAHIVVDGPIDDSIVRLLSSYHIDLPFVQTEGTTHAVVDLTVRLVGIAVTKYRGEYRSGKAVLLFDQKVPVPVRNLHLLSEGSDIDIKPCRVTISPYLDTTMQGHIDLHEKRGRFELEVHTLSYASGTIPLFEMKNRKIPVTLDYNNHVAFSAETLAIKLLYRRTGAELVLSDLARLHPYFRGPLAPLVHGRSTIVIGAKTTQATGNVTYKNAILSSHGKPFESFAFEAIHKEENTKIALDDRLRATITPNRTSVTVKKSDIHIGRLIDTMEKYMPADRNGSKKRGSGYTIVVDGSEGTLFYQTLQLPCRAYRAKIETDPFYVKFLTTHRSGEIHGIVTKKSLHVAGDDLPDDVIRGLTTLDAVHGGTFSFEAKGEPKRFKGTILMQDTTWSKNALYNNVLATLNTIPAVLSLKNPGFSKKGFKIKKGAIDYRFEAPTLFIDTIALEGDSANITGAGRIDFDTRAITLKMQVHFLESLTSVLSKIPVAGYLIFGDDGTIAITLNIHGPLENPNVSTETAKDIIKAPLNILQRTLTLPFKLFD